MRRLIYITIVTLGVGSALVALFLLSQTSQNTEEFDRLHITMLMINVGGVLVLFALTTVNLSGLFRDYRNRVPGARLKARMVGMFVGLAILPLLVVFYFSMQFINRGIDSWFNIEVEAGLDDALALSRAALEMLMRDHLETTVSINNRLRQVAPRQLIFELSLLRRESGASEITLYGTNSQIIATSSGQSSAGIPKMLTDEVVLQIRQNRPFVSLDDLEEGAYEIRTALPFRSALSQELSGVLQAHFPVPARIGRMAGNVDTSYSDYKRAVYLREPLKRIYSLTLTVVLMVSLLASIYG
ncbi:MAG: two-component sensor histidine kinase, partial [Nitrospirales bacterium]